jgi:hypothetical protein
MKFTINVKDLNIEALGFKLENFELATECTPEEYAHSTQLILISLKEMAEELQSRALSVDEILDGPTKPTKIAKRKSN